MTLKGLVKIIEEKNCISLSNHDLIFEPLRMYNITLHFRHGVTISYVTNLNDILTGHL